MSLSPQTALKVAQVFRVYNNNSFFYNGDKLTKELRKYLINDRNFLNYIEYRVIYNDAVTVDNACHYITQILHGLLIQNHNIIKGNGFFGKTIRETDDERAEREKERANNRKAILAEYEAAKDCKKEERKSIQV